jgi:hypothetical protein
MGRKVFITSDMSSDEKLIEVAEHNSEAATLWPWFLTAFDDWGRAEASPRQLKAKIFPMFPHVTVQLIEEALRLYAQVGLIKFYTVNGKHYMAVSSLKTWYKWQTHIRTAKREKDESRIPPPPEDDARDDAQMREGASDGAQVREKTRTCTPSPSPSPTPTLSKNGGCLTTSTAQGAEADFDKPPTNKDLIAELAEEYRAIEGIQPAKGDFAFIGALYNKHGYHEVLDGLNELKMVMATQPLEKPLVYLKAMLEKRARNTRDRPQAEKRIPRAFASLMELEAELDAKERGNYP